jgi:hypothetical protein
MSSRRLPHIIGLAFGASIAGCSDPLIGDWNMTFIQGGPTFYTYEGCSLTATGDLEISGDNLDAELLLAFTYSGDCEDYFGESPENEILFYAGDANAMDNRRSKYDHGHYRIGLSSDQNSLAFSCTLAAETDLLDCRDDFGFSWRFD